METKINVTKNDIKKARKSKMILTAHSCPIFQAFKRMGFEIYSVTNSYAKFGWERYSILLPDVANKFTNDFDEGNRIKTISFTLDIPKKYFPKKQKIWKK